MSFLDLFDIVWMGKNEAEKGGENEDELDNGLDKTSNNKDASEGGAPRVVSVPREPLEFSERLFLTYKSEEAPAPIEDEKSPHDEPKPGALKYDVSSSQPLDDVESGVYGSDEFPMYTFKVKPCSRPYSHDWTECPFAHLGENVRRRDPSKYAYNCVPCPEFRKSLDLDQTRLIAVDTFHNLALSKDFTIWAWGNSEYDQLGTWDTQPRFQHVTYQSLSGLTFVDIAAEVWHSTTLTSDGEPFTWGWNQKGTLGCPPETKTESVPGIVKRPRLVWTPQLQKRFVEVVAHIAIKNVAKDWVSKSMCSIASYPGVVNNDDNEDFFWDPGGNSVE